LVYLKKYELKMKINNHTKLSIVVIVVAALLRQLMTRQPQIVGVSFGFVPGYIHGGQGDSKYGICIYEKDDKLIERPFDVDYIGRPWYVQAFHVADNWTPPYEGRFNYVLMSSYSQQVRDKQGQVIAVLAVDVPLRELSQMAAQFYENQRHAVLYHVLLHLLGLLLLAFIVFRSVAHLRRLQAGVKPLYLRARK